MDEPGSPTAGPHVECLVADDNPHIREAMEALLESEGVEVLGVAQNGIEALELLEARPTTVIVLDLRLPDLSGLEVARRAAEIVRRKTAIVIYTSHNGPELVPQALEAGATAVVVKDSTPANLLEAISTVVAGGIYVDPDLRDNEPH